MTRIDLFTSPECPRCPEARAVVARFAAGRPGTEVHEWDISRAAGPAVGRGIFATPAVLVNHTHILLGVPDLAALARCAERFTHDPAEAQGRESELPKDPRRR